MGVMSVLDKVQGDQTLGWDPNNPEEIDQSRTTFDLLRGKGYLAYKINKRTGGKGEQIFKFEPDAESIVLTPPLRGG